MPDFKQCVFICNKLLTQGAVITTFHFFVTYELAQSARDQCYKTFFVRKLRIFIIS
jgi:hypothetical protein